MQDKLTVRDIAAGIAESMVVANGSDWSVETAKQQSEVAVFMAKQIVLLTEDDE